MAVSYSSAIENARLAAIVAAIDDGEAAGTIEVITSDGSVLAVFVLDTPSGTIVDGILTFSGFPQTVAVATTGTAAFARFKASTGTVAIDGLTVGTSAANLVLSTTSLVASQQLTLSGFSITHA